MAILTPTLTLSSPNMNGDPLNLSVTDSLNILGQVTSAQLVSTALSVSFAEAANYTKSFVYVKNMSTVSTEIISIEERQQIYINTSSGSTTMTINDANHAGLHGLVSVGDGFFSLPGGVPIGSTVQSIANATTFVTDGAANANTTNSVGYLWKGTAGPARYMLLGAGEFAYFPWSSEMDLTFSCGTGGTPVLETRIFQEAAI